MFVLCCHIFICTHRKYHHNSVNHHLVFIMHVCDPGLALAQKLKESFFMKGTLFILPEINFKSPFGIKGVPLKFWIWRWNEKPCKIFLSVQTLLNLSMMLQPAERSLPFLVVMPNFGHGFPTIGILTYFLKRVLFLEWDSLSSISLNSCASFWKYCSQGRADARKREPWCDPGEVGESLNVYTHCLARMLAAHHKEFCRSICVGLNVIQVC